MSSIISITDPVTESFKDVLLDTEGMLEETKLKRGERTDLSDD